MRKRRRLAVVAVFLAAVRLVRGQGNDAAQACVLTHLSAVSIDGNETHAWDVQADSTKLTPELQGGAFRPYNVTGGVPSVNSSGIACGFSGLSQESPPVDGLLAVAPGGVLDLKYTTGGGGFPGPISVYIAGCGADCSTMASTKATWTKFAGDSYSKGRYGSQRVIANGDYNVTVPSQLAAGSYLVRVEMLDLSGHVACPACFQIAVNGSATCALPASNATFPGLYANDTVLLPPTSADQYLPPGLPLWTGCGNTNTDDNANLKVLAGPGNTTNGTGSASKERGATPSSDQNLVLAVSLSCGGAALLVVAIWILCCWRSNQRKIEDLADKREQRSRRLPEQLAARRYRPSPSEASYGTHRSQNSISKSGYIASAQHSPYMTAPSQPGSYRSASHDEPGWYGGPVTAAPSSAFYY